jgi:hypothetical protein
MIVQTRSRTLRLIRQHDHALASGRLAHDWVGFGAEVRPLAHEAVLGITLHDVGWLEADGSPRLDPDTGSPVGFETFPDDDRRRLYTHGLDLVERIHPYAALLGSLHYARFRMPEGFLAAERARQDRLRERLGPDASDDTRVRSDLACLVLMDDLSLVACCAPPATVEAPDWLAPERVGHRRDGTRFTLGWRGETELVLDPFPFRAPVRLRIPCRDLPRERFADAAALARAWDAAPRATHAVDVVPPETDA